MKVAVLMNAHAGSIGADPADERADAIRAAFAAAGVAADVQACPGARLTEAARAAAATGVDAVVAAGGDGTVSAIAAALAGGDVPMAVLPLGSSSFGSSTTFSDFISSAEARVTSSGCCFGGCHLIANSFPPQVFSA
mgnify:CR=1 FL=1